MPTLKSLAYSKTQSGWTHTTETVGYSAQQGDLTVMIRRGFYNERDAQPLPGWQNKLITVPGGVISIDWTTEAYSGYIDTFSPNTPLAVFTSAHVGNVMAITVDNVPTGEYPNGAAFNIPVVTFSSTGSCVMTVPTINNVTTIYGDDITANGGSTQISYRQGISPREYTIVTESTPTAPTITINPADIFPTVTKRCSLTTISVEIKEGAGPDPGPTPNPDPPTPGDDTFSVNVCGGTVTVAGQARIATNDFTNARELVDLVGSDDSDPTADEYEGYIANGKNSKGAKGIQNPLPTQTEFPDPIPEQPKESEQPPATQPNPTPVGCTSWVKGDYDAVMSRNFILRNFTVGYADKSMNMIRGCLYPNELVDISGYSAQDRFCNLQALAQNVLEPLWSKYGQFRINSGIRNQNSVKNGVSQHVTGEAVDVQFNGWNYSMYWEAAKWIKDNLPYDQFIFEHSSKTGLAWLHLSFRRSGNRPVTDRTKVMTMYRGNFDSGLKRYG